MKPIYFLILAFGFNFYLQAQTQMTYGIKAGVNFAFATGGASSSSSQLGYDNGRTGLHLGIVSEVSLTENFSIQPELLYSQVGANYSYDNRSFDGIKINSDLKLDYLSLPILAKYDINKNFSLELGPQISYILNSEIENEGSLGFMPVDSSINFMETINIKDDIHTFDFGIALGASYKFLDTGFYLQARYVLGLNEVPKNDSFTIVNDLKNAVLQLSLGYKF